MRPLTFNGKFYAGPLNGVHRVADRLIREFDAVLSKMPREDRPAATLLLPVERRWEPQLEAIEIVEEARGATQLWEQIILPRRSRNTVLVNLANLAPIRHRRKITLIHDAQFLFPDNSYPLRQRLGYRWLTPVIARSSASVLTISDYSRQMLDLLGVAPRSSTGILRNGADHILETPGDRSILHDVDAPGGFVLMFGSHKEYKNNRVVFEAMASLRSALRLVVVGPAREELGKIGSAAPADTIFLGRINDGQLRALYEAAHCLAFPSRTEGFGLPPVEAMLCRCPVVASPAGAIPEVCRDAASYADVDDPAGWRLAFEALVSPAVRAAKIAAGEQRATAFTWRRAGEDLVRLTLDLAGEQV